MSASLPNEFCPLTNKFNERLTKMLAGRQWWWPPELTLHRALRRMAGLVFLLVFWVLAGACQRHGVSGFSKSVIHHHHRSARRWRAKEGPTRPAPSTCGSSMAGCFFSPGAGGRLLIRHGVGGFTIKLIHSFKADPPALGSQPES